ncbi:MAG: hypothetical protein VR64_22715 [Desulfatitalea sp. BRH_c12]|nr:MAG: hypothetical protein VR64_22715 [Desulfatitalea sp. BRH_c12]
METQRRSMHDRRSGEERRKFSALKQLFRRNPDSRNPVNRRKTSERRNGWVRFTKWSSVYLKDLKIAKFLKPPG